MKEISEAMLKAFSEIQEVKKNKVNPFYKSKYADLDSITNTIKPVLVKHGLFYRQICHKSETHAIVETIIHHESGEFFECGPCSVPAKEIDPQKFGSAFTYARRYSLSAAFGITTDDDDDGNNSIPQKQEAPQVSPVDKFNAFKSKLAEQTQKHISGMSNKEQWAFFEEQKWSIDEVEETCKKEISELLNVVEATSEES